MKKLTINFLTTNCKDRLLNSGFMNRMAFNTKSFYFHLEAVLINGIITFYSESLLKKFMNQEIPKLTLEDVKSMVGGYNIRNIDIEEFYSTFIKFITDENSELYTDVEITFLMIFNWKIYDLIVKSLNPNIINYDLRYKTLGEFIFEPKLDIAYEMVKERFVGIIPTIDYLDWYNPKDFKKDLFNYSLRIGREYL